MNPSDEPEARYVGLEHIESGTKRLSSFGKASDVRSAKSIFRAGDILYGKLRPYLNKIVRPDFSGVCSTDILVIQPTPAIEAAFIEYVLGSRDFIAFAMANSAGINLPRTSFKKISNFPLAVPPLAEQRRILARLDALEARSRKARAQLMEVPAQFAQGRQSLLTAAFRGDLTADWRKAADKSSEAKELLASLQKLHDDAPQRRGNAANASEGVHNLNQTDIPATWEITELRILCRPERPICYGILMPGPEQTNGVPYVRVADFPRDVIRLETVRKTTAQIDAQFTRSRLSAGDILLSIRGTVGRVAFVPPELANANITQDSARLSIHPAVDARFVAWMLRAPNTQRRMQSAVKGVAVRGLNIGDVRPLQIPLPPLAEQREIVRRLESAFARLDSAMNAHAEIASEIDRLDQSLLARAFSGFLVPQDPNDEPASALLERVHTDHPLLFPPRSPHRHDTPKSPRTSKRNEAMKKSRFDDDVKHQPYLANLLRKGTEAQTAVELFKRSELSLVDFYKQLAWEVEHKKIRDKNSKLEAVR